MGGRQSINLCVHILGPHEASAGWQPPAPGRRLRARPGTRAAGGLPRRPWQRSPSSEHSATHLPPPAPRLPVPAPQRPPGARSKARGRTGNRSAPPPSVRAGDPQSATPGRRSAARSAEQCAAAPPLTSHVAVQAARRGPDCPGHCGIATPGCPPREWELAGSGHGSMASAPTRRAAARDWGIVAVQPLIAARRFPPLRGPSPAPAPPGRRADAPSSHAQPRPPPARPSARSPARPGPRRRLPPLRLRGLGGQPGRPARLDERLESAAGPAEAEAPHRLKPGGRRAGKKAQGCWWGIFLQQSALHSLGVLRENGSSPKHKHRPPSHLISQTCN